MANHPDHVHHRALAASVHDISAGLAVSISLLKGWAEMQEPCGDCPIEAFETVLADLRSVQANLNQGENDPHRIDVARGLREEAKRIGVDLDLRVVGDGDWLAAGERQLLHLAGREALRNVRRHAGSTKSQMTIDLTECPFVFRTRDWGCGLKPEARAGAGIETLRELAGTLGCELVIGSQPGLGTELVLIGRRCPRSTHADLSDADKGGPRSVVADKSPSSRRRVAARRPIPGSRQQIR